MNVVKADKFFLCSISQPSDYFHTSPFSYQVIITKNLMVHNNTRITYDNEVMIEVIISNINFQVQVYLLCQLACWAL